MCVCVSCAVRASAGGRAALPDPRRALWPKLLVGLWGQHRRDFYHCVSLEPQIQGLMLSHAKRFYLLDRRVRHAAVSALLVALTRQRPTASGRPKVEGLFPLRMQPPPPPPPPPYYAPARHDEQIKAHIAEQHKWTSYKSNLMGEICRPNADLGGLIGAPMGEDRLLGPPKRPPASPRKPSPRGSPRGAPSPLQLPTSRTKGSALAAAAAQGFSPRLGTRRTPRASGFAKSPRLPPVEDAKAKAGASSAAPPLEKGLTKAFLAGHVSKYQKE